MTELPQGQPPPNPTSPADSLAEALDRYDAALDQLFGVELSDIDGEDLLAGVERFGVSCDRADAFRAHLTSAMDESRVWADHGSRSAAALLMRRSPHRYRGRTQRDTHYGAKLLRLPIAAKAFAEGLITSDHVKVLVECLHPRYGDLLADFEEELVDQAGRLSWPAWMRLISYWKDQADERDPASSDEQDLAAREVHLSRSMNDRGQLSGTLTPFARQVVRAELDRLCEEMFRDEWSRATNAVGEGDLAAPVLDRSPGQRRHDALLMMAQRSSQLGVEPAASPVVVYVHCTEAELVDALDGITQPADVTVSEPSGAGEGDATSPFELRPLMREYEDGTPISRRMLARLAIQAQVKRVVFSPEGQVLELGRPARFFSASQREAIAVRDRVCQCGCGLSARWCEADHIIEVRDGGETVIGNGQPLCHKAHRFKTIDRTQRGPAGQPPPRTAGPPWPPDDVEPPTPRSAA